jgi:hypothetical protein
MWMLVNQLENPVPITPPDYNKILEHLNRAQTELKLAVESMHSMNKMSHLESYVLGHVRGAEAVLNEAVGAVQKTEAYRRKRTDSKDKDKEPES